MKAFFRLALMALMLIAVALISALTAMRLAIHGREVSVPDLVHKTPAEARLVAAAAGLELSVERQYYSPTEPEGSILSQLPPAGSQVRRGFQVRVAESLGPQRVQIPNVLNQSARAANINIRRRGLDIAAIAQMPLAEAAADQVLSQDPPPNASSVSAPKISLLIAGPQPFKAFVTPNFVGQPLGSATLTLQDAGMKLGTVTQVPPEPAAPPSSAVSPASIIVRQTPEPGEKILVGSPLNFEVR